MRKIPHWILEETILKIHELQIAEHGGSDGIRDIGLLQSAIRHPQNLFSYTKPNIAELAAAYAERIIKNHPFIDGNKRTAYVVKMLFLKLNGLKFICSQAEKVIKFVQLASGELTLDNFITWIKNNTEPSD